MSRIRGFFDPGPESLLRPRYYLPCWQTRILCVKFEIWSRRGSQTCAADGHRTDMQPGSTNPRIRDKTPDADFVSDLGVRRPRRHIDPQYQRQICNCTGLSRPFPVTKTQNPAYRMGLPVRPAASADARAVPARCSAARRLPCRSPYAVQPGMRDQDRPPVPVRFGMPAAMPGVVPLPRPMWDRMWL